jgi:anti-anti-sigma regulatory factor
MRLVGEVSVFEERIVVSCQGDIIFGDEVDTIVRQVIDAHPAPRLIVVDLSRITELRSSDLGQLWLRYMKARALGWRLMFVNLSPQLHALLESHSIEDAFEIFPDEETAIRASAHKGMHVIGAA